MAITTVSDTERSLRSLVAAHGSTIHELGALVARLQGEANVLHDLLRQSLATLDTIDKAEHESDEEYALLCQLRHAIAATLGLGAVDAAEQPGLPL